MTTVVTSSVVVNFFGIVENNFPFTTACTVTCQLVVMSCEARIGGSFIMVKNVFHAI